MEQIVIPRRNINSIMKHVNKARKEMDDLYEELEIIADPEFMNRIKHGLDDYKYGRVHNMKEFKKVVYTKD